MDRKNVLWLIDVRLYLLTEASDVVVDSSGRWVGVVAPHFIQELVAGYYGALLRNEVAEKAVLSG